MTNSARGDGGGEATGRCGWCRRVLPERSGPGRPRRFCSGACRQWNWVSGRRARDLELGDDEVVVSRTQLDALHDDLYVLECAVEDTRRDLDEAGTRSATELHRMVAWLLGAAESVGRRRVGPDD